MMPRFFYRMQIRRAIRKYYTIPDIDQMLRHATWLGAHEFGARRIIFVY